MNTATTLVLTVLVSAATAFAVGSLVAPASELPAPSNEGTVTRAEFVELQQQNVALVAQVAALLQQQQTGDVVPLTRTEARSDTPDMQKLVQQEVERALAENMDQLHRNQEPRDLNVSVAFRDLTGAALSAADKKALWQRIRDAGQLDELIKEFERQAAAGSTDSQLQAELAWAYQHRMLASENGPERGKWGAKAAAKLEDALRLDDRNWDARYSLAQHNYWADMRGDATRHFETLIQQQGRRVAEPKHAGAYLWLGNILMDRGDKGKALQTWNEGLQLFPSHQALQERVDAHR